MPRATTRTGAPSSGECTQTARLVLTAATPGVEASCSTTAGGKVVSVRLDARAGTETYTSACNVMVSQRSTVSLKLWTITVTPTVVAIATISAATATAVRLSAATTPR